MKKAKTDGPKEMKKTWGGHRPKINLIGKKFNYWTVIGFGKSKICLSGQHKTYWLCRCDCGLEKEVYANSLISGKSKSCHCISRRPPGAASLTSLFSTYKTKAIRQKKEFAITEDYFHFLAQQDCFYCGKPPSNKQVSRSSSGSYVYNGLDRFDNNKGYVPENIRTSCKNCNLAKRSLSWIEFFEMVTKIYEKHNK